MEARLDRFGRIVLPKDVRDDFSLEAGDVLEVRETSEGILLTPVSALGDASPLRVVEGVLVFAGVAAGDLGEVVTADRNARLRVLAGALRAKPARRRRRAAR